MTNTLTIESCFMKWEGGICPPIPISLGAFKCGSIFTIYQPYLEAIPTKFHVSTSKILISFAVLAQISWKGGLG